ncbi:hypothetical protein [uncultured Bosea sp.]|uniref:hypothetical protein n=1 Tax=uncultured Bosea sp. TaxID=211457 RepID=UPI00263B8E23|nr:hypothetical protein [uncultured Bosea sp.]
MADVTLEHIDEEIQRVEAELLEYHADLQASAVLSDLIIRDDKPRKRRRLKVLRVVADRIKAMIRVYEDGLDGLVETRRQYLAGELDD